MDKEQNILKPFIEFKVDCVIEDLQGMFPHTLQVEKDINTYPYESRGEIVFKWYVRTKADSVAVNKEICRGIRRLSNFVPRNIELYVDDYSKPSESETVVGVTAIWCLLPYEKSGLPKYRLDIARQGYTIASNRVGKYDKNGNLTQKGLELDLRQIVYRSCYSWSDTGQISWLRKAMSFNWEQEFATFVIKPKEPTYDAMYLQEFHTQFVQNVLVKGYQLPDSINTGYRPQKGGVVITALNCMVGFDIENRKLWPKFTEVC